MKSIATFALIALLAYGTPANASEPLTVKGIDIMGLATVQYEGQTYHLTVGDTLGGETLVAIDSAKGQVIVKDSNRKLHKIHFTK